MDFSVIIPVYNRPDELDELLQSLTEQSFSEFEVIVVEDGSTNKSDIIVDKYKSLLHITYFEKSNSGPGLTRNEGAKKATKDYLVFFDSDCIIPKDYFQNVKDYLTKYPVDAFGGPDRALPTFTPIQKAINYSMTSFFTTGGIRGGKKSMDKFHPRSFNLGVTRKAFDVIGGYGTMRFGEDVDFSLRLLAAGFSTALIPDAFVYHKRRTNFRQFFKQVSNSGIARINLHLDHPGSLKLVHLLPTAFVVCMVTIVLLSIFIPILLLVPLLYCLLVFIDSCLKNKSIKVGLFSIIAAWVQLFGYGIGFLVAVWNRLILKKGEFKLFEKKFYK
ncbi:MAG: glycosyltransferase [Dysgonamonadaceae bacterium]|jgi:glycosyltransferase involved in cell wall biosynthesis|nr:glycosyltransferase [Dysgonamonadaceae bacterium]MDD3309856.1 glycosyltransferase [Dysgonamonadaceae bacterium]MDD3899860.1 glycosyltransferase [Dysgonamonadaceae bacterium]MDD4398558.1 glycosyltransferase [Dysgonamonadaceae bacterium]MEA5080906.1 glycosyltransferase [Dysgonamonadaceae bacterium]